MSCHSTITIDNINTIEQQKTLLDLFVSRGFDLLDLDHDEDYVGNGETQIHISEVNIFCDYYNILMKLSAEPIFKDNTIEVDEYGEGSEDMSLHYFHNGHHYHFDRVVSANVGHEKLMERIKGDTNINLKLNVIDVYTEQKNVNYTYIGA
jgi:hypothetical protein